MLTVTSFSKQTSKYRAEMFCCALEFSQTMNLLEDPEAKQLKVKVLRQPHVLIGEPMW